MQTVHLGTPNGGGDGEADHHRSIQMCVERRNAVLLFDLLLFSRLQIRGDFDGAVAAVQFECIVGIRTGQKLAVDLNDANNMKIHLGIR